MVEVLVVFAVAQMDIAQLNVQITPLKKIHPSKRRLMPKKLVVAVSVEVKATMTSTAASPLTRSPKVAA